MNTNAQTKDKVRNVVYVALNFTTGLTDVTVAVRKPNGDALSPAPTVTEQGNGIYVASYTPDVVGMWQEKVTSATNGDNAIRAYTVIENDADDLAADIAAVDGKIDVVDGNVDSIKTTVEATDGKVDVIDGIVDSIKTTVEDTNSDLAAVAGDVTDIKTKTDNLPADTATALQNIQDAVDALDVQVGSGGYLL